MPQENSFIDRTDIISLTSFEFIKLTYTSRCLSDVFQFDSAGMQLLSSTRKSNFTWGPFKNYVMRWGWGKSVTKVYRLMLLAL